jgi:hypothetical protein
LPVEELGAAGRVRGRTGAGARVGAGAAAGTGDTGAGVTGATGAAGAAVSSAGSGDGAAAALAGFECTEAVATLPGGRAGIGGASVRPAGIPRRCERGWSRCTAPASGTVAGRVTRPTTKAQRNKASIDTTSTTVGVPMRLWRVMSLALVMRLGRVMSLARVMTLARVMSLGLVMRDTGSA